MLFDWLNFLSLISSLSGLIFIVLLNFFGHELSTDKVLVDTSHCDELFVGASLLDFALLHADDLVCVADSAQPMSDDNYSLLTAVDQLIQGLLHLMLTLSIKG